ncbi:MAG: M24 family metallopeptidase [bacterium]|jgi:Xaa-Pro aminopeptidase|nr:M24 family metallopeptidase [bacterium]
MTCSLEQIQELLRREGLDGWLFFVLKDRNPVAERLLGLPPGQIRTRRAWYWIPAAGQPVRLEHRIESRTLASLPGLSRHYLSHQSLREELARLLAGARRVAMETSPLGAIPTLSLVDAGTVDLVRSLGPEVVSSGDLAQAVGARLAPDQLHSHLEAAAMLRDIAADAFALAGRSLREGHPLDECGLQAFIKERFLAAGLVWDHDPIVAGGRHSADPHHEPAGRSPIERERVLLIDLWAKLDRPGAVYADQTWMGFTGGTVPDRVGEVWTLVRDARRAVRRLVADRQGESRPVQGWEADEAARRPIRAAGLGERFLHRTGHSIDEEVHGRGANLDNLETREERRLIPGTVMSVEPGVYLDEFGIRSEYDLLIDLAGEVQVAAGTDQEDLILVR